MTCKPYTEHCPECVETVKVEPYFVVPDDHKGVFASYRCPRCRTSWRTGWAAEVTWTRRQPA